MKPPFTKVDVDHLVGASKFIKIIPPEEEKSTCYQMQARVYLAGQTQPEKGLIVMATAKKHLKGIGRPRPSSALVSHGIRIRGLDYEILHDNPDGSPTVRGWHEHLWSPEYKDDVVRNPGVIPSQLTLRGLFLWGLRRWNISVKNKQEEL